MADGDMIQVHMLTAYPATLLNRDDAGLAKRVPFGGASRIRVSSQCLKKHWRDSPAVSEGWDLADRSTRIYQKRVMKPLMDEHDATEDEAATIARFLMDQTVMTDEDPNRPMHSAQLLVLTRAETQWLEELGTNILQACRAADADATDPKVVKEHFNIDDDQKKSLKALEASVDTAMFGRMVTSDTFARVDSAVSVAHAFTTHAEESETDYFTAVDTLKGEADDSGAGLIQDTELTSGVFYLYGVIDMNQLRDNLGHRADDAEAVARRLVQAMATVSPGAKRGSTAPYAYAEYVLLERGTAQPRTLANAFLDPVSANGSSTMLESARRLQQYRDRISTMYGHMESDGIQAVATIHPVEGGPEPGTFPEALDRIFE